MYVCIYIYIYIIIYIGRGLGRGLGPGEGGGDRRRAAPEGPGRSAEAPGLLCYSILYYAIL